MGGIGGYFTTSERNIATGTQKAKWKKFTMEIIAEQPFPAKKLLTHPHLQRVRARC